VTCNTVVTTVRAHGAKRYAHARLCTTVDSSGHFKLSGKAAAARVRLMRGRHIAASGTALLGSNGRVKLLLSERKAPQSGLYTLVILRRRDGRWTTTRQPIRIG
jgi:hypothetical protein